jgi:hypothetical protein
MMSISPTAKIVALCLLNLLSLALLADEHADDGRDVFSMTLEELMQVNVVTSSAQSYSYAWCGISFTTPVALARTQCLCRNHRVNGSLNRLVC